MFPGLRWTAEGLGSFARQGPIRANPSQGGDAKLEGRVRARAAGATGGNAGSQPPVAWVRESLHHGRTGPRDLGGATIDDRRVVLTSPLEDREERTMRIA